MKQQYRLKKEAVPFFQEKHATSIYSYETWEGLGVDQKALEEIEVPFLVFGHQSLTNDRASTLSGWNAEGSHFHFTINFPGTKHREHDKFSNGKVVRSLMNKIQDQINYHFADFVNEETVNQ